MATRLSIYALFVCFILCALLPQLSADEPKLEPLGINLEGYDYPFPVHYLKLKEQGQDLELAYMDVKPETPNGHTVILMHGKNFCGAYWKRTASDLAAAGFRVVIPDQIGFGKSTKADQIQYSFQMMARHMEQLLDELKIDSTAVLGHSMGGMVATRFALDYPDRTEKLILCNPIGLEDWKAKGVPYRSIDAWEERELKKSPAGIRKYQLESYYDGKWKEQYDPWVELLARPTLSPEYPRLAHVNALTYDMIFTQPVCYEFGNIKMPTLLIIGQRDRTALGKDAVSDELKAELGDYPQLGRQTQQAIPGSQLVELEGIGHLPPIEAYEQFFPPLIGFLEDK